MCRLQYGNVGIAAFSANESDRTFGSLVTQYLTVGAFRKMSSYSHKPPTRAIALLANWWLNGLQSRLSRRCRDRSLSCLTTAIVLLANLRLNALHSVHFGRCRHIPISRHLPHYLFP
ncbi:hypothetical protein HGR01_40175 (plasmid) [Tolypothrix sp. PCC 7712]|uniref:hypothetical protein n=1 Tax=Tolypothrix sp. PCC 7712 TaxID=2596898 RepID=UPI0021F7EEC7|nr:hypothetical protein [Tolypothrix sp. PCC 7712]UYD31099.1 hypothetical protein HGR01_40175 [Tolypothrix sp. PCC 7712]